MRTTLFLLLLLCVFAAPAASPSALFFYGKLNPELAPNNNFEMTIRFDAATDADKERLPVKVGPTDNVFARRLKWPPGTGQPLAMLLVEPQKGDPYLFADTDLDGNFTAAERVAFPAFKEHPGPENDLVLRLPYGFSGSVFEKYPVTLRPAKINGAAREVSYSYKAFATGFVDLDGKKVLVRYGVETATSKVDAAFEGLGVDTDGNGRIDSEPNSPETDFGNHGIAVFRVGANYFSTESVDSKTGNIVLRSHPASDYERIELTKGAVIPDFSFVDFEGKSRKLSDYRGKYVLLDFWGTWCPPCVAEMPELKQLYQKFRARNFEVIGMDNETRWEEANAADIARALDKAKSFAAEQGMNWTLARSDSIEALVQKRFRVRSYPMKLVLDPQGKLLLLINNGGYQELTSLLDKTLPR